MQRFQFRLASVLKWRGLQLELERGKLQALFAERTRIDAELARLVERRSEADGILSLDIIDGQDLAALDEHRNSLVRTGERLRNTRLDCEKRINDQRTRVMTAERSVRLLDRLKDRRQQEWQVEADRELETMASETFLAKYAREHRE